MAGHKLNSSINTAAAHPDYVYVLAAVNIGQLGTNPQPAEHHVRAAIGQGQGDVLMIADDAAAMNNALVGLRAAPTHVPTRDNPSLTAREMEVLGLVAKGLRTTEIADALVMSGHTVNTHLKHLFRKLGVRNRSEAVFEAMSLRLIEPYQVPVSA